MILLSGTLDGVIRFVTVLLIFLFVLLLAVATTKFAGSYQRGQLLDRNIKLVESFRLGPNKFIQIVQVGEHYLVLAVSKDNVNLLMELDEDEVAVFEAKRAQMPTIDKETFSNIFENVKQQIKGKK